MKSLAGDEMAAARAAGHNKVAARQTPLLAFARVDAVARFTGPAEPSVIAFPEKGGERGAALPRYSGSSIRISAGWNQALD